MKIHLRFYRETVPKGCAHTERERKTDYKELAQVMMETMSQDLQSELASWRPMRASSIALEQPQRPARLKTLEELMFPFKSGGRKKSIS